MLGLGIQLPRRCRGSALTPAQALARTFNGTGLVDGWLVFDPTHYSTPGATPGVLVDALGGSITYTAPNTQATPAAVHDSSGYYYASADGVDDTLRAGTNQIVAWYSAVVRSPVTPWSGYGGIIDTISGSPPNLAYFRPGATDFDHASGTPRAVRRNGTALVSPFDLAPITTWQVVTVYTAGYTSSLRLGLFQVFGSLFNRLHLAALAIRYTDPTSAQQTQIEAKLAPVRDALIATA